MKLMKQLHRNAKKAIQDIKAVNLIKMTSIFEEAQVWM